LPARGSTAITSQSRALASATASARTTTNSPYPPGRSPQIPPRRCIIVMTPAPGRTPLTRAPTLSTTPTTSSPGL
jgi:hypothetical protein